MVWVMLAATHQAIRFQRCYRWIICTSPDSLRFQTYVAQQWQPQPFPLSTSNLVRFQYT
jgi:hypothetical protein